MECNTKKLAKYQFLRTALGYIAKDNFRVIYIVIWKLVGRSVGEDALTFIDFFDSHIEIDRLSYGMINLVP